MIRVYCCGINKEDLYVQEDFGKYTCSMSDV